MQGQHAPDWIEASTMLREAMEQYRDQHYYPSLPRVVDDLIDYIEEYSGKWLNEKTVKRDVGNRADRKKQYRIPDWRVRIYAKWLYEKVGKERNWIATWLDATAYSAPGKLLVELSETSGDIHSVYRAIKTNVPSLKTRLWGRFLGRQEELRRLRQWADHQRHPIAVLYGFGGNGKTTIQQKVGEEFVHGVKCPLRWPYDGAVWVSAVDYPRGQPGLLDVLREIAETFGMYTSVSKRELRTIPADVLKNDVTALLEERRILVLLDNVETIAKPHQVDILQFFNNVRGSSQTLISTRYRPDWFLERENDEMYRMAHVLIRVDGLSAEDATTLVQEFLKAKSLPDSSFDTVDIARLIEVTQNNPKTILTLLGLVEQGVPLSHLLDSMTSGTPDADRVYEMIIDHAWEELLSEDDRAVLMAKAFFSRSVGESDLGQIAGVEGGRLRDAIKKLAAISFFEPESSQQQTLRIRTHPLAQEFARRILHDHPDFEQEAEKRWWAGYGPSIVRQAGQTPYESLRPDLEEDVANILEHLEHHLRERSPYCEQAVTLFGGDGGLGYTLRSWSRYDDVLRVAEFVLDVVIKQQDAALIGTCALRLITPVYVKRKKLDEAERWVGLAIEQNATLHNRWLEAAIENARGFLYRSQGYLRAAEQAYQKALNIFLELDSVSDVVAMYKALGELTIRLATQDFEEAIDTAGNIQAELAKAERYFDQAEAFLNQERIDKQSHDIPLEHRDKRAIIARLRGDLEQARDLLQSCIGRFRSSYGVANLYRELALIEHLTGNTELAYSYEEKGLNLLRQLGLLNISIASCYTHCGNVIGRMKQEGTW